MKAARLFRLTPLHAAAACSLAALLLSALRPSFVERLSLAWLDLRCALCGLPAAAPRGPLMELPLVTLGLSMLPALVVARIPRVRDGVLLGAAAAFVLLLADLSLLRAGWAAIDTVYPLAGFAASCATGLLWGAISRARTAGSASRGPGAFGGFAPAPPDPGRAPLPEMLGGLLELIDGQRGFIASCSAGRGDTRPGRWKLLATEGIPPSLLRLTVPPFPGEVIAEGRKSTRPVLISRRAWHDGCLPPGLETRRHRPDFMLWLPLVSRGKLIGMAYVDGANRHRRRSTRCLPLLESFGARIATALEAAAPDRGEGEARARAVPADARATSRLRDATHFAGLMSATGSMHALFRLVEKAASGSAAVLIEGETGTGKELIARAIHYHGLRRERVFIAQNCAALPETLLESELFGHVRGAFTGALHTTRGLLAMADKGTVFLDEIADCSPAVQAKLLRFLQNGVVRPVGGTRELALDVRIISATNRDLEEEVSKGTFRKDLFYRLNVIPIRVPPLRERRRDIPCLASFFLAGYAGRAGKPIAGFTGEAMKMLAAYDFPGNVRELENEIARIAAMHPGGALVTAHDLSDKIRRGAGGARAFPCLPGAPLRESLKKLERNIIMRALNESGGNISRAAVALGMSRYGLYKKMVDHGLSRPASGRTLRW